VICDLVTIFVGKKHGAERQYTVSKARICEGSDAAFFRKAFDGAFREGVEGQLHLDDDDPRVFEQYLGYMFFNTNNLSEHLMEFDHEHEDKANDLIALWGFGDRYGLKSLQNFVSRTLIEYRDRYEITQNHLQAIYNTTLPKTPLRRIAAFEVGFQPRKNIAQWTDFQYLQGHEGFAKEMFDAGRAQVDESEEEMPEWYRELCLIKAANMS